ncbi:Lysophospholipase, alpha-beta hydrolase superfamily [Paracoccus isoporae]|uniref:Lysophospholipase, alpha-beta hydrolase superfamily n=1 Tax=Paracoccus isoporae TaxID=591205 RepID=A0A1G7BJB6_9RHOB|nr:alpha/beta fold hydrolase [Paracoccus isoporae]SDE26365.1 Lysophospholipase, alpha-beta hydrolase superfamily [Paracoccus isoporae]
MVWLLILLAGLAGLVLLIWMFGPREPGRFSPPEIAELPEDLDAWLYQEESGVRPEVSRRIVWAGRTGAKTPVALVYLHGFSASSQEIRPVPDLVAAWRGANLYFARLDGHGLDGASMEKARVADWARDVAEAVAIGRRIGERVVLIGSSTGGTLAAMAARDPELGPLIDGVVLISPNFGLQNRWAFLARQPLARQWLPLIAGRERCFEPRNDRHREFWTSCYPMASILPMVALVGEAARVGFAEAHQPVLAMWSDADQVVDPAATRRALDGWGGEVSAVQVSLGPGDDASAHVIAGDILSPGQTAPVAARINGWITREFGE